MVFAIYLQSMENYFLKNYALASSLFVGNVAWFANKYIRGKSETSRNPTDSRYDLSSSGPSGTNWYETDITLEG